MEFEKLEVEKSEETIEPKKPLIKLENLTKEYNGKLVLKGINLTIYENEFVTLLGPSGCGKTTTLRLIGGFEVPSQGSVWFKDKNMTNIPSYQRPTNTVFQRYALFPHLNVYENVAFGLRILYKKNLKIKNKIHELIYNIIKEDSFFSEEKLNDYQISLKQKKMTALDAKVIEEIKKNRFRNIFKWKN